MSQQTDGLHRSSFEGPVTLAIGHTLCEGNVICRESRGNLLPLSPEQKREIVDVFNAAHDSWASQVSPEFIQGRGLWERENHAGYTNDWRMAGRFTREHAEARAARFKGKYIAVPLPRVSEPQKHLGRV